ncbi:MAG: DUF2243 domain-containing protein [Nocardioidaceae bacterium]
MAPHGQQRARLSDDHACRFGGEHPRRRVLPHRDLGPGPRCVHGNRRRLASGAPGTELELPLRPGDRGLGDLQRRRGPVDHQILGVHHVRDDLGGPLSWDIGFLVLGVGLVVGGWLLHQRGLRGMEVVAGRGENRE